MNPQQANIEFVRGNVELMALSQVEGRIAAEGALPYPPGVLCVAPGGNLGRFCAALFPGAGRRDQFVTWFRAGVTGVYIKLDDDRKSALMAMLLNNKSEIKKCQGYWQKMILP